MRIPKVLYTYLTAEILAPFLASFIILNGVLILARLIPFLDVLFDFGIGLADFIRLCAYLAPQLFLFSIPLASMTGIIIGITRLANDGEIMALKASGIGLLHMLPPVFLIALCAAGLTGLFSVRLIPISNIATEKLLFQLAKEKIDKGLREKQFSENIGNVVLYADKIDKNREWHGVYVSDIRDRKNPVTIMAQTGTLLTEIENMSITLTLNNGSLHRAQDDISQDIRFQNYIIRLFLPAPSGDPAPKPDKKNYTLEQLRQQANQYGTGSEQGALFLIEYHKRLVLPVGCLILSMLSLPLGFFAGPGERGKGVPLGLAFFVSYFILLTAAMAICESLILPIAPTMWFPNIIFAALAFYLIRVEAYGLSTDRFEKVRNIGRRILSRKGK